MGSQAEGKAGDDRAAAGRGFWVIILALSVLMVGGTLPAPLYLIWQRAFGFSEIVLTLIFAVYFLGAITALLFFGRLSDQVGRRPVILSALCVATLSTLALILAKGLPLLFVGRALSGFGNGLALSSVTAYVVELRQGQTGAGEQARAEATPINVADQMLGLGAGPLLAGLLAQYAVWPTLLPFYVLLALLAAALVAGLMAPETRGARNPVSFRPRLGVPSDRRAAFASLAATGFCIFAMVGLFTSLVPSVLAQRLHNTNHAVAGAVAFELFLVGAVADLALRRLRPETSLSAALALIPAGLVPLMLGVARPSVWFFLAGTAIVGLAVGMGFSKTLAAVHQLAPSDRQAQVLASYFVVTYAASMLPVVGMGLITQLAGPVAADYTFACIIGVLALTALAARLLGATDAQAQPA